MQQRRTEHVLRSAGAPWGVLVLAALAGCASSRSALSPPPAGPRLSASDFLDDRPAPTPTGPRSLAPPLVASDAPPIDINAPASRIVSDPTWPAGVKVIGPIAASEGVLDVVARPGPPRLASGDRPAPVGQPAFVDAKIGDINGKPVYASQFFDTGTPTQTPLGAQLAAKAAELKRQSPTGFGAAWTAFARQTIERSLYELVRDELLRAEAMASLTPEQRQGLFAFVQGIQDDFRRESGGSKEAAKRRIAETEGLSPEQSEQRRQELELVRFQLGQKVSRRVNISWRDINQAYAGSMYDKFHQPPAYRFRLVTIPAGDSAARAEFESRLAGGEAFAALAESKLNGYRRDVGGLEVRAVKDDPAKTEFFPNKALDAAAHALAPGQTSPPVALSASTAWVYLESVAQGETSLYDAQIEIEDVLRDRRFESEMRRYVGRLLGRASVTSLDEMEERLMRIAHERYLGGAPAGATPSTQPAPPVPGK